MRTKNLLAACVILLILSFCPVAVADIVGGWDVAGQMKTKVAIKGYGSDSAKEYVEDFFEFEGSVEGGGTFSSLDYDQGTWEYVKKKVFVHLDANELASFFEDELEGLFGGEGYDVDVYGLIITKNVFYAKERKNGTIKGKSTLVFNCRMYFNDEEIDLGVKVTVTYGFTGTPRLGVTPLGAQRPLSGSGDSANTLPEAIKAQVLNRVSELIPQR